jgi:hypothetical protein
MAGFAGVGMTGSRSAKRYLGNEEPPIEELLTDAIAVLLRRSDGLSLEDVYRYVADAMARKRYGAGGPEPFCGSGIPRSFDKLS